MISPLMISGKNVKVSQKRCLEASIESFTGFSPSDQVIVRDWSLIMPGTRPEGIWMGYETRRMTNVGI